MPPSTEEQSAFWDRRLSWAAVGAIAIASAWLRFRFLAEFDTAVGIDGYYYPIQIRSLSETGTLYYPSAPLVPRLMWLAAQVVDPLTAAKLVSALGTAAIGIPVMGLCRQHNLRPWASAVAATVAMTSGSCLYMSVEFAKNGVALTVALFGLWGVALALKNRRHWPLAVAGLVAAVLAHKLATALFLAIAAAPVLARARESKRFALGAAALLVAVVLAGLLAPAHVLSVAALEPLTTMWTADPSWSGAIFEAGGEPLYFGGDLLLSASLAALSLVVAWRWKDHRRSMFVAAALWTLLVALPFIDITDTNGLGPRLRLTAFLTGALSAAVVLDLATERLPWLGRAALVGVICGIVVARPTVPRDGVVVIPAGVLRILAQLPAEYTGDDQVLIVPERQLVFAAVWQHRTEARLRPEGVPGGTRIVRIVPAWFTSTEMVIAIRSAAADPPPGIEAPRALDEGAPLALVAMREATWDWLLTQLPEDQRRHYRRWPTP